MIGFIVRPVSYMLRYLIIVFVNELLKLYNVFGRILGKFQGEEILVGRLCERLTAEEGISELTVH